MQTGSRAEMTNDSLSHTKFHLDEMKPSHDCNLHLNAGANSKHVSTTSSNMAV